ncbi:LysR family transcriptional regulator [Pseudomaricurvus alkylphenolicus]|uniref:LysR family transcriptional regulator n=1 Tax=Pseudomaricurvus alkylphenolicus TaxID=1306991 RepID=UPI00141EED1F|nr:LysR family transcriptional regulator [Pseudomaricurvus alkylphenolicus]NIB40717.1 LysR family transcriptional regulator [Pseudomaricurvus alkylphenolicus]
MRSLDAMLIFNKVIETGSFSRAAERLNIAKSSVSKKISALERQLGVILVQRSTRQLKVTDEGWHIYEHSKRMLEEYEQAQQVAARFQDRPTGKLRITAPPLFGRCCLASLLPQFQQDCPDVTIELFLTEQYSEIIGEGYDVSLRMGKLQDSELVQRQLCHIQAVCCASPQYINRTSSPQTPQDLRQHQCLVWQPTQSTPKLDWTFTRDQQVIEVRVPSSVITNDHQAIKEMTLEGGGITILPTYAIENELNCGRLISLLPEYQLPSFPISLLYPKRQNIPAKTRAFVDFLKSSLADAPQLKR